MIRTFLYLLCLATTVIANEVYYNIRASKSQCLDDQCNNEGCVANDLTLAQFVNNCSDYLANNTNLIFLPGNYYLESELIIENVQSFSMFAWPAPSSKTVITCDLNARFEFGYVDNVTISGLDFIGCLENYVLSVGQFRVKNSEFTCGNNQIFNGSILSIDESVAMLNGITFNLTFVSFTDNATILNHTTTPERVVGISLRGSTIEITQSLFEGINVGPFGAVISDDYGSNITIINTTFIKNIAQGTTSIVCGSTVRIYNTGFVENVGLVIRGYNGDILITHTNFINNEHKYGDIINITHANLVICQSTFTNNTGTTIRVYMTTTIIVDHSKFVNNNGTSGSILDTIGIDTVAITASAFVNNTLAVSSALNGFSIIGILLNLDGAMITIHLSEFISNTAGAAIVHFATYGSAENLTNNVFRDNSAGYDVYIDPECGQGLSLSLGSSQCIQCPKNWSQDLIGIMVAAFIVGIVLVILMLALNMTVAIGTLNGILFYANIVAVDAETYFLPFTAPGYISVFISWLNLNIGFDVCFSAEYQVILSPIYKALIQLVFPFYVFFLVIIVIIASECSSKFAKIIGKGNPVAVLATLTLISVVKLFNVIFTSVSLLYLKPAYGSQNLNVILLGSVLVALGKNDSTILRVTSYILLLASIVVLLLCIIYTALLFSWQWLLNYQDKTIFKWMRYQKLRHFIEPYHAPYTAKCRYWTGLLLFVRVVLYLISVLNFSLDPRVDLMAVIFVVGSLILLKGVIAKRIYKNWLLDILEIAIYFNLIAFAALTWYNLDFGGNQVAVAYTSVIIIFILLSGVIVFHILRYTNLYKYFKKAFKWTFSILKEKLMKKEPPSNSPEDLNGYRPATLTNGRVPRPIVTHTELEIVITQPD